jgi:Arylsulfotransferase (ASST)
VFPRRGADSFPMPVRNLYPLAVALVAAIGLAATGLAPKTAGATAASVPPVAISPLPGTPDAAPTTQISFLGVPSSAVSQIVVRGSRSGTHPGTLEPYSTGTGGSYVLAHAFTPGESVTVTALETLSGEQSTIGTHFAIAKLYKAVYPPPGAPPTVDPATAQTFASLPHLHPPKVTVTTPAADPALGDIFLAPKDGSPQQGPMIVNPAGQLVWFAPLRNGYEADNVRVRQYLGQTVLTYWEGRNGSHGHQEGVIDSANYAPIATVKAGNGLAMDLHEFDVEPDGVAFFTFYEPEYVNASSTGNARHSFVVDAGFQEVDVRTGLVMFEWHAMGHVPMSDSHTAVPSGANKMWDWFHINSIDIEPDQNIVISSRGTWAVYELDHNTGKINWSLGGRASSFRLGPGVRFAWQHDATLLPDGTVQLFDNEDDPEVESRSRGEDVALNFTTHTATLVHQYISPDRKVLANSQGSVQALSNGDHFVGWGAIGLVSEFSPSGGLTFEMSLPGHMDSYRAYRFPWSAVGQGAPTVAATSSGAGTKVWASWNGDTEVTQWIVLGGATGATPTPLGTFPRTGFETRMQVSGDPQRLLVRGLDSTGATVGQSATISP